MIKKIIEATIIILVICFSFYYTDRVMIYLKEKDPVMQKIHSVKSSFKVEAVNATIEGNTVIPGYNGIEIDENKSYAKMKRLREFNPNMIYYKEICPKISSEKIYNKYVIKGNSNKKMVSVIFNIKELKYLDDILTVLKSENVKANFFINEDIINKNIGLVNQIISNGDNIFVSLNIYNKERLTWANNFIKSFADNENYCLTVSANKDLMDLCSENNTKTIMPSVINAGINLSELKKKTQSGSIIFYDISNKSLNELKIFIKFLKSKGYSIETIKKLLSEQRLN